MLAVFLKLKCWFGHGYCVRGGHRYKYSNESESDYITFIKNVLMRICVYIRYKIEVHYL